MFLLVCFLLSLLQSTYTSSVEKELREKLFTNYSSYVRPIENVNNSLELQVGLAIQNLEEFDQIKENIALNIWVRMNWNDYNLNWNRSDYDLNFISLDKNRVWVPNLELLNAANLPEVYTLEGGLMLYNTGDIMWSKPGVFKFSCSLDLKKFPFDTQTCSMKFGSWTYSERYLNVIPNRDQSKQLDILDGFSHSEWKVKNTQVKRINSTKKCCPNENFPYLQYDIKLERYTHYYKLNMGMTIALVIVSFIIMLMEPDNVSRTGTAVFIPLTILALELTLANKIPVVGYYTLLDQFFVCCFVTSMLCSMESGIIYALITTKSKTVYRILDRLFECKDEINDEEMVRNQSYDGAISNRELYQKIFDNKLVKTINYDDKQLYMTKREKFLSQKISMWCIRIDNIFRIIFPTIFFIFIGTIYSNE